MIDYKKMLLPKKTWGEKKPQKRINQKKKPSKKKKYKKVKSIMQDKSDRRCFLSMLLDNDFKEYDHLEEHHVLFGTDKWISDAYGLRVNLRPEYHRTTASAVHNNQENAELLKKLAQQRFMEVYPDLNWMEIVGRNYLDESRD